MTALRSARAGTVVQVTTTIGNFNVELYDQDKPLTVSNFLAYVRAGRYTNMFLHRAVTNFVIQGGGYWVTNKGTANAKVLAIPTSSSIKNEFKTGAFRSNVYGTIAMAKTGDPDSATSQFFINLADNSSSLDSTNNSGGFTVFGAVTAPNSILNRFNVGGTNTLIKDVNLGSPFDQLPVRYSAAASAVRFSDLIYADVHVVSPLLTSQPANATVREGQAATFTVAAEGSKLGYSWLHNGTPIPGASNAAAYHKASTLLSDAGAYAVIVTNSYGAITSSVATLTVIPVPKLSFTNLAANARITNTGITQIQFGGTTTNALPVAAVYWRFNHAGWNLAASADEWKHWNTSALTPAAGSNVLEAYAMDTNGTLSATQSVQFSYFQNYLLSLSTNGSGKITLNQKSASLPAGARVTATATPAANWIFTGWSGDAASNTAAITLVLRTNLSLQASFATNPILSYGLAGNYSGLFQGANPTRLESLGAITLAVTAKGAFSGSLVFAGQKASLSGQLSPVLIATNRIKVGGASTDLRLEIDPLTTTLAGSLSNQNWMAAITAYQSGPLAATNTGKYTLLLAGSDDSRTQPGGEGFATVNTTASGLAVSSGALADSTVFSPGAQLTRQGLWPVFVPLYSGKGALFGWLQFTNEPDSDLHGTLTWMKPAQKTAYYSDGFTNQPNVVGSRYTTKTPATGFAAGMLTLSEAGLTNALTNAVTINTGNAVQSTNQALKMTLTPGTGLFQGTLANPVPGGLPRSYSFKGALLAKQTNGAGFFLGTNQTGRVQLQPRQ
jgi:peptidyl-prolyl cis-trans isomerase A (cyclophilin A)